MFNFFKKEKLVITNCVFNCGKEKCPKWIILEQTIKNEQGETKKIASGKCADAWSVYMMLELKNSLEKCLGDRNKSKILTPL